MLLEIKQSMYMHYKKPKNIRYEHVLYEELYINVTNVKSGENFNVC